VGRLWDREASVQPVRRQNIRYNSRRKLAECGPRQGVMLSGEFSVLQAPIFDGLSLDPFALFDDGCSPAMTAADQITSVL
jgi:hypothetical protein